MRQTYSVKHVLIIICLIFGFAFLLSSCDTEATRVNRELAQDAESFNCERRLTVYNTNTGELIACIEGYMSLDRHSSRNELVVTCKTGENTYKKNNISTPDGINYVMEDINGTHTDPYHYKCFINAELPPEFELIH